jgi:hypothetical protein
MHLELSEQDRALLAEILQESYTDLRMEISNTDTSTFKDELKQREARLEALLRKLETPA